MLASSPQRPAFHSQVIEYLRSPRVHRSNSLHHLVSSQPGTPPPCYRTVPGPVLYALIRHFVENVTSSSHGLCWPTGCSTFARNESHMSRFPNLQPKVKALSVNQRKVQMRAPRDGMTLVAWRSGLLPSPVRTLVWLFSTLAWRMLAFIVPSVYRTRSLRRGYYPQKRHQGRSSLV